MTELERELLEALKYVRRFVKPADVDTAYLDAAIERAEAKAKEPQQCKCGMRAGVAPCSDFNPARNGCFYCGHDRACHIVGGEG